MRVRRAERGGDGGDGGVDLGLLDDDRVPLGVGLRCRGAGSGGEAGADLNLEPPAAVVGAGGAPEFHRADLGDAGMEPNRHPLTPSLAAGAHHAEQGGHFDHGRRIGRHQITGAVASANGTAGEREQDWLAHQQLEIAPPRS